MSSKILKNYQISVGAPVQIIQPHMVKGIKPRENIRHTEPETEIKDDFTGIDTQEEIDSSPDVDVSAIIDNAHQEAALIIKEAGYEAERLMEEAQRQAEEHRAVVEQEAWQTGYDEGYKAGYAEAQGQYEDLLKEAELIRDSAKNDYASVLADIEGDAIEMILDIAKNVIGVEISFNKEDILYLVKQAFEKCSNRENILLKVSPEDFDYVSANKQRLISMVDGLGELEIKNDLSLKVGACIVETRYGSIDAGVQTKLRKIEEAFRQAMGR